MPNTRSPWRRFPVACPLKRLPAPPTRLTIAGDVSSPLSLTPDQLKALPRGRVSVKTEDGAVNVYEGVFVGELLKRAGAPLGRDLRGDAVATYVVATASDGYQAAFSIAELDPAFTSNDIMVADTIDGKPLFGYQGPLRIVAPKDSRGARSIRMLERIEVAQKVGRLPAGGIRSSTSLEATRPRGPSGSSRSMGLVDAVELARKSRQTVASASRKR